MVYRTSVKIMADMLEAASDSGRDGIPTTRLLSKANISHVRLTQFVKNMTGAGLITKIEYDGRNTFVITERGRQYLESYRKFSDMAESFGLDL